MATDTQNLLRPLPCRHSVTALAGYSKAVLEKTMLELTNSPAGCLHAETAKLPLVKGGAANGLISKAQGKAINRL